MSKSVLCALQKKLNLLHWEPTGSRRCRVNLVGNGFQAYFNTFMSRQDGHHFPDGILKWIFLNEIIWISIKISLKFFPRGPINNIPELVQIMAWRLPTDYA